MALYPRKWNSSRENVKQRKSRKNGKYVAHVIQATFLYHMQKKYVSGIHSKHIPSLQGVCVIIRVTVSCNWMQLRLLMPWMCEEFDILRFLQCCYCVQTLMYLLHLLGNKRSLNM
jgi:hypothetical protein